MVKKLCDICLKEINQYANRIHLYSTLADKLFCLDCFRNRENWDLIHQIKESSYFVRTIKIDK